MLHKNTSKRILLATVGLLAGSAAFAQLNVNGEGDVGIGFWPTYTASDYSQFHVVNDFSSGKPFFNPNNFITAYFEDFTSDLGYRYGIYNIQYAPKGGSTYGHVNQTYTSGGNPPYSDYTVGFYNYTGGGNSYVTGINNYWDQYGNCAGGQGYGIYNYGYSDTQDDAYGIYNYLYNWNTACCSKRYGIWSVVDPNGVCGGAGIYSSFPPSAGPAGLFDGDVQINGNLTVSSDERKKENIGDLKDALSLVQRMKGHTYTFKSDDNMNLAQGEQIGFLAQELEQVLPNLVSEIQVPSNNGPGEEGRMKPTKNGEKMEPVKQDNAPTEELKAVNYIGVIPVLVEAIKEQQVLIERQQAQIQALEEKIGK